MKLVKVIVYDTSNMKHLAVFSNVLCDYTHVHILNIISKFMNKIIISVYNRHTKISGDSYIHP